MKTQLSSIIVLLLLSATGCTPANLLQANSGPGKEYNRRKEVFDERYDYMRSAGMDYSHGRVPSSLSRSNRLP